MREKSLILLAMYAFLIFSFIFLTSCKKDEDTEAPVIELTSPVENTQYNVFDEIPVIGTVYDNKSLVYVKIELDDENLIPVLPAVQSNPETNNYQLNQAYAIDDIHLASGTYYLHVQAKDDFQATNKYVKLHINETPKKIQYYLAVTRQGSNLSVIKIDTLFQTSTMLTVTSDYLGSGVSSDYGQFYICGSYTGDMQVYALSNWEPIWNVPVTIDPPFAWFTGFMLQDDGYCWVGYREGKYEKYDPYGNLRLSVNTATTWAPRIFCRAGDKLVTEEKNTTGPERALVIHYEFSGAVYNNLFTDETTLALVNIDDDNVFSVTNDNTNQGHLYVFNVDVVSEYEPPSNLGPGEALCAVNVGTDLLIGHDAGIYRYVPSTNTTFNWISGVNARALFYDETQNIFLAAQDKSVKFYTNNWPSYSLMTTVNLSDTIIALHAVYNKD
jgi:hypothetical protein